MFLVFILEALGSPTNLFSTIATIALHATTEFSNPIFRRLSLTLVILPGALYFMDAILNCKTYCKYRWMISWAWFHLKTDEFEYRLRSEITNLNEVTLKEKVFQAPRTLLNIIVYKGYKTLFFIYCLFWCAIGPVLFSVGARWLRADFSFSLFFPEFASTHIYFLTPLESGLYIDFYEDKFNQKRFINLAVIVCCGVLPIILVQILNSFESENWNVLSISGLICLYLNHFWALLAEFYRSLPVSNEGVIYALWSYYLHDFVVGIMMVMDLGLINLLSHLLITAEISRDQEIFIWFSIVLCGGSWVFPFFYILRRGEPRCLKYLFVFVAALSFVAVFTAAILLSYDKLLSTILSMFLWSYVLAKPFLVTYVGCH